MFVEPLSLTIRPEMWKELSFSFNSNNQTKDSDLEDLKWVNKSNQGDFSLETP